MTPSANVAGQSLVPVFVFVGILSSLSLWFLYISFAHRRRYVRAGGLKSGMIAPANNAGVAIVTVFLLGFASAVLALTLEERNTIVAQYWLLMAVLGVTAYGAAHLFVRMGDAAGRDRDLAHARLLQLRTRDSTALARMGLRLPFWIVGGIATLAGLILSISAGQNVFAGSTAVGGPILIVAVLLLVGGCSVLYAAHRMGKRDAERVLAAAATAPAVSHGRLAPQPFGTHDAAVLSSARTGLFGITLGLFVGGFGFMLLVIGIFIFLGARELKSWVPASAEIVGSQFSTSSIRDPQTQRTRLEYSADVHYRFTVDGRVRTSVVKSVYSGNNLDTVVRYVDSYYGRGKIEAILYDPTDPSHIAFQPKSNNEMTGAVFGAIGLVIMAGAALMLIRAVNRQIAR